MTYVLSAFPSRSAKTGLRFFSWALLFVSIPGTSWGGLIIASSPFTLQPGSTGGDVYVVSPYGGAPQASPSFFSNGALQSPGQGYGSLGNSTGNAQVDFGGINAPNGNLAAGINTSATGASIPNPLFGSGNLSFNSSNGGIGWSNFGVTDSNIDNNFSVNASHGVATYLVNSAFAAGQAGVFLGIQAFLPAGTQGFAALVGTFTLTSA